MHHVGEQGKLLGNGKKSGRSRFDRQVPSDRQGLTHNPRHTVHDLTMKNLPNTTKKKIRMMPERRIELRSTDNSGLGLIMSDYETVVLTIKLFGLF